MQSKDIFNIAAASIITALIWLAVSIYSTYYTIENTLVEEELKKDIQIEQFDAEFLLKLNDRFQEFE